MEVFIQEIRQAVRRLFARPGFSLFVVLTLALGIGATTTVLSLANALFLRAAPYEGADRLVVGLSAPRGGTGDERDLMSYPDYQDLRRSSRGFDGAAVFSDPWDLTLTGGGEPERVLVTFVSSGFFDLLGVRPALGRAFLPEEDRAPGGPAVVLLSHELWRQRFGGDPGVLGRSILLGDLPYTVAGVLPREYSGLSNGEATDLYIPVTMASRTFTAGYLENRDHRWLTVLARLAPGTTQEAAQQEIEGIGRQLEQTFAGTNEGVGFRLWSLTEYAFGFRDLGRTTLILTAGAFFVLLIGCINVVNLLLVRSMARSREMAILISLGASRGRLVGRLLLESVLLSLAGGAVGALVSFWTTRALVAFSPLPLPPYVDVTVDGWVLAAALGLSLLAGLVVGLLPAVRGLRAGVREALQQNGRTSSGPGWGAARRLLIVSEVATALMLLVGAGLLIRSFMAYRATDYGFETDGLVIASVRMSNVKYPQPDAIRGFYAPVQDKVAAVGGVEGAHLWGPGRAGASEFYREVVREGAGGERPEDKCRLYEHRVTAGTLESLEIGLVRGRMLEPSDRPGTPGAAVVSESAAAACWPGQDPVGKRFKRDDEADAPWFTVVGVVHDARHRGRDASAYTPRDVYYSLPQVPTRILTLLVKTGRDLGVLGPELRQAVLSLDPDLPLYDLATMEEVRHKEESESRFYAVLMGGYAAVALLLAASGLYSVLAYSISQRTREIGIRMALGAKPRDVLRLIGGEAMTLVCTGLAVGLLGAVLLTRTMVNLLYGVDAADLVTFVLMPLVFLLVAFLASYLPTRRATRVDPLVALQYE